MDKSEVSVDQTIIKKIQEPVLFIKQLIQVFFNKNLLCGRRRNQIEFRTENRFQQQLELLGTYVCLDNILIIKGIRNINRKNTIDFCRGIH